MTARGTMLRIIGVAAFAGAALTCGGDDPADAPRPRAGWLNLSLSTPNIDDGGLLFSVTGGRVDSITTTFAHIDVRRDGETALRVIIRGDIHNGVLARIWVPNVRAADAYVVTVLEAAARRSFVQRHAPHYTIRAAE